MKVRLAACTAPSPVPASTATSQNSHLACTKNESTVTAAHCISVTVTTKRGPRVSVGRAHSAEPINALICTTRNRPMISVAVNPRVLDAKTAAKRITVFTPSS